MNLFIYLFIGSQKCSREDDEGGTTYFAYDVAHVERHTTHKLAATVTSKRNFHIKSDDEEERGVDGFLTSSWCRGSRRR